jgi:hypothetical protein
VVALGRQDGVGRPWKTTIASVPESRQSLRDKGLLVAIDPTVIGRIAALLGGEDGSREQPDARTTTGSPAAAGRDSDQPLTA